MPRSSLVLLTLVMTAAPCSAQLVVQGVRDLDFGPVLQGVDQSVSPTDPVRSGQFYFSTPGIGTRIRIRLTLPSQLNGPSGAQMRIRFGPNDAMARGTGPTSLPAFFNPNSNVNYTMVTSADANIWLGGTVQPATNQPVGTYTNTVVLTVTIF